MDRSLTYHYKMHADAVGHHIPQQQSGLGGKKEEKISELDESE